MPALSDTELKAVLAAEKADALAATQSSKLSQERSDAMDYYNGDVSSDIPSIIGRSTAVSTDVSDTIEGMMPTFMEIFCGGDEVVRFSPVGPEDVKAAEQETDYVNHVFMQQNPGFLVLYSFIKDALLSKVGIVKFWTEEKEDEDKRTYYDQTDDALAAILQQPGIEVLEHSTHPPEEGEDQQAMPAMQPQMMQQPGMMNGNGMPPMPPTMLHDVTVVSKKKYKCHKVEPVPPEEFGIARRAKNIKDCGYCFHETTTTVGDLIEQGYDEDQVKSLPSEPVAQNTEQTARDTVGENQNSSGDDGLNGMMRPVLVTEHYIKLDYKKNGDLTLYRIKTGGTQGDVLKRKNKPDIEEADYIPFAAMTPVIVTHRFFGKSIADLVMDIQRIKTALLRGMLDNIYQHNNTRTEISESHASKDTLDDLLVSRIGGIVRTKMPGGLREVVVQDITASIYPALEYFDATREWRTGVTRQAQGIDANALQNQSATAVNQAFTAAQARIKLIARIFAETGVRDLFTGLHAEIRKYGDQAQTVRLRNEWVQVNPSEWKERNDMTIEVGLGTGGKQQQFGNMMALGNMQKELLLGGKSNIVSDKNLYSTAKEIAKIIGKKDVESFFTDPATQPPPQAPPDPKMIEAQIKMKEMEQRGQEIQLKAAIDQKAAENKAEIERIQAQADIATQERKSQAEMAIAERKAQLEERLMLIDAELKQREQADKMAMARELHQHAVAKFQMGIVAGAETHDQKMKQAKAKPNKGAAS